MAHLLEENIVSDAENRLPWNGEPETQQELVFETDQIDEEVEKFVNEIFTSHPGKCDLSKIPTTKEQHHKH